MNICVYAASSEHLKREYFAAASALGQLIALGGHRLIFGGGAQGLMGACAQAAAQAGGQVIGIAPRFFDEPGVLFQGCTKLLFTDSMRGRKRLMEEESDAFIALPGGIGTFEEFLEMLTLKQLGRHSKPMVLVNTLGYYEPMRQMLSAAAQGGFMSRNCFQLFAFCGTPVEAVSYICGAPAVTGSVRRMADYTK